jgi:glucose dehydrogenase
MSVDVTVSFIIRFLLAFIFARGAAHKLRHFSRFTVQLDSYRLVPDMLIPGFSCLLILVEVFLTFGLLVEEWLYPSYIAAGVLALYAGASAFVQGISWALVSRNCVLAILALATASPITSRSVSVLDVTTVMFASIAVICIYASLEQAMANQRRQIKYFALRTKDPRGTVE